MLDCTDLYDDATLVGFYIHMWNISEQLSDSDFFATI